MNRALPTKEDLAGQHFGKLTVLGRSERRASRGARTVPLWECLCECGNVTYKATDKLTGKGLCMCGDCAEEYAASRMRERAGYVDGTQISRLTSNKLSATNSSGARGVYWDKNAGKWRARLRFKGKIYNFGSYASFEDAVSARQAAEAEYFGEYIK